ncbi:hypothetical protein F8568_025700 [Actinomadura sp. LD22]|uniref:DUF3558 domain-containing protein n=1 Tax=Actinomadura physcomitrii TaxID=2650748 RepID=A0A6I4MBV6_9ACTN|nr:hypothetical protein [Actinomadura physcomitrii]MWA03718.1 hypothetical protein [Actinomadura physcomitrii]
MSGSHRSGEDRTGDGEYGPYPGQDGRRASGTGGHQASAGGYESGSGGYPTAPGTPSSEGGGRSSGGYSTGGYPTGQYSTGQYSTGGYPTGGYSTGGYPAQGGDSGRYPASGYTSSGGYPTESGGYPGQGGGSPSESGRYSTGGGAYPSGSGRYPSGGYPSESGSYPIGDYRTGGSYETGAGSGNYPADSGGYSRRDRYESDSGDYRFGSGDHRSEPGGRRSDTGGYASGSGGYATESGGYPSGSGGHRAGSGGYRTSTGSHRVARERRGGRRGAILLAAGGAVAACALAVFVLLHGVGGGSEHGTGQAVGSGATDSSPTASGERTEVPDSCSVVGGDLINRLAPGAEQNPADNYQNNEQQNGCVWGAYAGDNKRQLTVELRAIAGTASQTPTAVAQSTISAERSADESGKALLAGQELTQKSDLQGVGDEGYLVYSVDKGQGSGEAITNVRLANVLVTIHYSGSDGGDPLSAKDAGDGATEAAKTVLQALSKA